MDFIDQLKQNATRVTNASSKIRKLINELVDENSFVETDVFTSGSSFLDGTDALGEGVVTGYASIEDKPVHIIAENIEVLKGSLGKTHADKMMKCLHRAQKTGTPVISIIDSCGVRLGEGVAMIESFADLIKTANAISVEVPHICVIKGTCVGMMNLYAAQCDFVIMSEQGVASVNSPMTLAANEGFMGKTSDLVGAKFNSEKSGLASFTYKTDADLKVTLNDLLNYVYADECDTQDDPNRTCAQLNSDKSIDNLIEAVCDDGKFLPYMEKYADEVRCGFSSADGMPVALVATDITKNEGYLSFKAIKKITKFVDIASDYNLPIITLVNSKGIHSTMSEEVSGMAEAAANLFNTIAIADVPKIAVVCGSATGYAYATLASKSAGFDYSVAFCDSIISPVNSEVAINLFYADELKKSDKQEQKRAELMAKYAQNEASAFISAKEGYIDNIIEPAALRPYLCSALTMLLGL